MDEVTRLSGGAATTGELSPSSDWGRFAPGTIFAGRFRIVAPLGRGGMGEVYRAEDLKLEQPVALKLLPDHLATDPARLAQFHNEVRIARTISHRNVCRTYNTWTARICPRCSGGSDGFRRTGPWKSPARSAPDLPRHTNAACCTAI